MTRWTGVDFGTTNSVVTQIAADGSVATARFGNQALDVFRTVLCFWTEASGGRSTVRHAAGPAALERYASDPFDARLMMSLKTYLAQRSFSQTQVFGRMFALEDLVGLFLRALFDGAGVVPGDAIMAGRPVRFAGERADEALGERRLRESYRRAGMGEVELALEPVAAGYRFTRGLTAPATVLVGDFGGGTSDFSLFRFEPGSATPVTTLGNAGLGIAGDNFDYRIIDHAVSPLLGKGGSYSPGGVNALPIPPDYFSGFAQWHRLSLMRSPRTLRDIAEVARTADHPERLQHLIRLIEDEAGYALYRAVSDLKAALSRADEATLRFEHDDFRIERRVRRAEFEAWIAPDLAQIGIAIDRAMAAAALTPAMVDRVFLTGGTAFVPAVRTLFTDRFGPGKVSGGGEFLSVAEGLALMARDAGRS